VQAIDNPARVAFDFSYQITVRPSDETSLVTARLTARRCFPRTRAGRRIWFSFCSDLRALDHEFARTDDGCIAREIINPNPGETLDTWERRVSQYAVDINIDGRAAAPDPYAPRTESSAGWRVVRTNFLAGAIDARFVQIELNVEYDIPADLRTFPVKFSSYYTVGATQVTFEVARPGAVVEWDEYMSSTGTNITVTPFRRRHSAGVSIRASEETVLPPGAGAVLTWRPLLEEPPASVSRLLPSAAPLPPQHTLPQGRRPSSRASDPLVEVTGVKTIDVYSVLGILPGRVERVRSGVASRLGQAEAELPDGFSLVVLDGWRTLDDQKALLLHYAALGPTSGYVASLDEGTIRPPHATGGAVDLTLCWLGKPLALGTHFDSFTEDARLHAFEQRPGLVRELRRALAASMLAAGFAPYELEWWHWSYGDDVWADYYGVDPLYEIEPDLGV
jgi:D-alanyl-D-alanine dipeptidase